MKRILICAVSLAFLLPRPALADNAREVRNWVEQTFPKVMNVDFAQIDQAKAANALYFTAKGINFYQALAAGNDSGALKKATLAKICVGDAGPYRDRSDEWVVRALVVINYETTGQPLSSAHLDKIMVMQDDRVADGQKFRIDQILATQADEMDITACLHLEPLDNPPGVPVIGPQKP